MKIAYASRTGNVESIVNHIGLDDTLCIQTGNESIDGDFVIFTYTDGYGDVPAEVESFLLAHSSHLRGVVVSGDLGYGDAYCLAGDKIADMYDVPCLYKVENDGTSEDITCIKEKISTL